MLGLPASELRALRAVIERYQVHAEPFTPVPIWHVARMEGWQVRYRSPMGQLYGVGVVVDGVRVAFINEKVSDAWQRYAMAHELAHDLCGHQGWFTCQDRVLRQPSLSREEVEANIGAALILVPWHALLVGTPAEVAERCGVPLDVVELRRSCGLGGCQALGG